MRSSTSKLRRRRYPLEAELEAAHLRVQYFRMCKPAGLQAAAMPDEATVASR